MSQILNSDLEVVHKLKYFIIIFTSWFRFQFFILFEDLSIMQHRNVTNVSSFSFDAVMSLKVTLFLLKKELFDCYSKNESSVPNCEVTNLCCSCYITLFFIEGYSQLRAIVGAVGLASLID